MPVFYILVIFSALTLCVLLSSVYHPIGALTKKIFKDAKDAVMDEEEEKE